MTSPLISIITPSFNQAQFLEETLRSVLEQGYPNLEYIVIDGASTDGSVDIIRKYADRLTYWVSEPDHGQAEAINKGFARAHGEIVAWLNSDDVYRPGALAAAAAALQANPQLGFVFSDVQAIDADGQVTNLMRFGDWGLDELMCFNIIGQPGVFMRHSALEKAGGMDANFHYLLDHQLWLRIAERSPVHYLPVTLAAGRFHAAAKNVAHADRFGQEAYAIVEWMKTRPGLQSRYQRMEKRVWAGAHRINARYLLDGGQPKAALAAYGKSLKTHPATALVEWHRMVYALLCLVGLDRLKNVYLKIRTALRKKRDPQAFQR